ncbi:MAG: hypothetical protein WDN23_05520 [Edaphobacter sp.]
MKKLLKSVSFAAALALTVLGVNANAQTVEVNSIGSSALFLEAGLGASSTSGLSQATCLWTSNNSSGAGNVVSATDTSSPAGSLTDAGNAWIAWTPSSQPASSSTCSNAAVSSSTQIFAFLQTDSVVGDRCLFNAHIPNPGLPDLEKCRITFPSNASGIASSSLIYPGNDSTRVEFSLPPAISTALNNAAVRVNAAATDIRPEDAWFATKRALTPCGAAITIPNNAPPPPTFTSTQYLGLGYTNGQDIQSAFGGSPFHVIDFSLLANPVNYAVTPVGATPILVVINGTTSGFGASGFHDVASATLAKFLDGRFSLVNQISGSSTDKVNTIVREPLSGTYNTMEYNVPNRTSPATDFQTSQDVGSNQLPITLRDCNNGGAGPLVGANPLSISSTGGGLRQRAIGTGQEITQVVNAFANNLNVLGYGFWSKANFAGFSSSTTAKYLTVDTVDPLLPDSIAYSGVIPTSTTDLGNVTLDHVKSGDYPIWSLLRFVTLGSTTAPTAVANLATDTQNFTVFGGSNPRPDFVTVSNLLAVRSHFVPPAPDAASGSTNGQPNPAANGSVGLPGSACTNPEQGGDVGGVVLQLLDDSTFCGPPPFGSGNPNGQTGMRR